MKLDDDNWVEPVARQVMTNSMSVVMFRERDRDLYAVAQVFRRHGVVRAPNYSLPGWSIANLEDTANRSRLCASQYQPRRAMRHCACILS